MKSGLSQVVPHARPCILHLISVTPELETYKFGNGGLLKSHERERVTVPVVLAQPPVLISYSVVDSPVLSLLVGRVAIDSLGDRYLGELQSFAAWRSRAVARGLRGWSLLRPPLPGEICRTRSDAGQTAVGSKAS